MRGTACGHEPRRGRDEGGGDAADVPRVHCLVHMAGIWAHARERCEQADGLELHFMVNYLATVLLTEGLLPTLRASAQADGSAARVVAVGSAA